MELAILGLLAIAYVSELASASVPMLVLVQNGVGAGLSLIHIWGIFTKNIHKISVLWIQEIPEFMPLAYDISFQPFIKRDIKTISIWSRIA